MVSSSQTLPVKVQALKEKKVQRRLYNKKTKLKPQSPKPESKQPQAETRAMNLNACQSCCLMELNTGA